MTLTRETHHRLLPVLSRDPHARGKRSTVTCHLKCDDACTKPVPNITDNSYFRDIAGRALSRRTLLGGAGAGALAILVAQNAAAPGAEAAAAQAASNLPFTAITPVDASVDQFDVPAGYRWAPIIRWGDPLFSTTDRFDADDQTARRASRQFGYNNDYLDIIPINSRNKEALLVANHEYTNENIMFPPTPSATSSAASARPRTACPWSRSAARRSASRGPTRSATTATAASPRTPPSP
jgi:secreted PhoX family phosphatase